MISQDDSDEALMQRYARGDVAAFERLYRRHELRVFRYLLRSVRERAAANDLLQEVWFAVARAARDYQATARFTTWLFTVAHHRMVDHLRSTQRHQLLSFVEQAQAEEGDDIGGSVAQQWIADARTEPSRQAQSLQEAQALLSAVEQLPMAQREAFLLQAEAGLSVEEIALATGASFETVKSRLRYARNKLRALLWHYA